MKKTIKLTLAVVFVMGATSLFAQKFGRINTQEVISVMPEMKEMQTNIEAYSKDLQESMENIALPGCICAVQCQHRHKLFLFVRRNQAIRQTFIRRCFQADNSRVLDGAVVGD